MHGSKTINMPDIRTQLKLLKKRTEEVPDKPRLTWADFGRGVDRLLLELAVHIPVAVAIGISAFGYMQYGLFAWGLVPLAFALSFLLSRTYAMAISTHRGDVALFLMLIGFGAFCAEAYGVHLGAVRFNEQNAADGLQTFSDEALIAASVILGLMNLFSRRAYVTGHGRLALDMGGPEAWWRWRTRRKRLDTGLANAAAKDRRTSDLADDDAVYCYQKNGAWPLGYTPTETALARIRA